MIHSWGNQHQAVLNMSGTATPYLSPILHDYLEYTQDILHGFSKNIKVDFFWSEISADPPDPPYGQKFLPRRPKMTLKFRVKFYTNLNKKQDKLKKIRTRVSEDFPGLKVTTPPPPQFGGRKQFLRAWAYFENFELWDFLKKNFGHFKLLFFSISFQK